MLCLFLILNPSFIKFSGLAFLGFGKLLFILLEVLNLSLLLCKVSLKLFDSLLVKLCMLSRAGAQLLLLIAQCFSLLFLKSLCDRRVDHITHCALLIRHNGLPLLLHLFEHFSWPLQTFIQLLLFLRFARLHSSQHGLLATDIGNFCIDFPQVFAELRG